MDEFEPVKKTKFNKIFYFKYAYVLVLALVLYLGVSYSLTFFKQNYKIAEGSLTTASVNITLDNNAQTTSVAINATGLDKSKQLEFSKSIDVDNTSSNDGYYTLNLERTSGINLSDLEYAIFVDGTIKEINDVPSDGLIYTSTIMGGETQNIEVRLWPKDSYTGSETTFVGNIILEKNTLTLTGADYIDTVSLTETNNYVNFNCNGTNCEKWRIVGITDNRLVLTTNTYYGNTFTNSNLFNTGMVLNDYSLVTSMSEDNNAVYLKKTVEITDGSGTIDNPYILTNNNYNPSDEQIIGYITYDNDGETTTQPIYNERDNYISQVVDEEGFQGWSETQGGTVAYQLGDTVNFTSNTTLYAVIRNTLSAKIKQLCNDSSITYVQPYTSSLGTTMDTYDGRGTEDVCYYTSSTSANLAGQNGNVLFGDYCWQIVRTTDTGGIKLIYNGVPTNDGKCPTSGRPSSIGVVGTSGTKTTTLSGDKLYGTKFEIFDDSGTNKFRLIDTNTYNWSDSTYQNIIGKYTCLSTSDTCTALYYVGHYQSNTQGSTEKYTIGNNVHYSQIGTSSYNAFYDSPALVGYMYNTTYNYQSKSNWTTSSNVINYDLTGASTAYFYGDKATWNPGTNMYDLTIDDGSGNDITPTTTTQWQNIRNNAQGMYTCRSSTATSCATVYYIVANVTGSYMYSVALQNNETYEKTVSWTFGTDFTISGTNYVLTNPDTVTISLKDWYTNYSNAAYKNIYVCADFTSSTCSTMYYIVSTSNYQITYNVSTNSYIFGNSVEYQNGSYTILDTNTQDDKTRYQTIWDWYKKYNTINNSHYTCFTNSNTCACVYYVFYTSTGSAYYIKLENGETVENALKKMLNYKQNANETDANINVYNSSIKGIVDNFYETKLSSTARTFLDASATFCNDRAIVQNGLGGGWLSTGGTTSSNYDIRFSQYSSNRNLTCTNETDRLSTENTKAQLTYPIGLLSEPERYLMNSYYVKTGQLYWGLSPGSWSGSDARVRYVYASGTDGSTVVGNSYGVRPVVSLRPDVEITGVGTYDNPYVIVGSN